MADYGEDDTDTDPYANNIDDDDDDGEEGEEEEEEESKITPVENTPTTMKVSQAILNRSRQIKEDFGETKAKTRKPILGDVIASTGDRNLGRPANAFPLSAWPALNLLHLIPHAPLPGQAGEQASADKSGRIVVPWRDGETMELRTLEERREPAKKHEITLRTWHGAYTEGRKIQLQYVLDPTRAPYGWSDNHGFERCLLDSRPEAELTLDDKDVHYAIPLQGSGSARAVLLWPELTASEAKKIDPTGPQKEMVFWLDKSP